MTDNIMRKPVIVLSLTIAEGDLDPDRLNALPFTMTRVANVEEPHPAPKHGWACLPADISKMALAMACELLDVSVEALLASEGVIVSIEEEDQ